MRLAFLDSPITRAELRYQRCAADRRRPWQRIVRLAYPMALTVSLVAFFGEVVGAVLGFDARPIGETLRPLLYVLFVAALVAHFNALLQTLILSSDSVAREKRGRTFDMVLLTGVNARQLVCGKWWATVRRMWRNFLAAGALRLGLVTWLGIEVVRMFSQYPQPIYLNPLEILWAGATVILLSLANVGVTAAFGVLASTFNRSNGKTLVLAIVMRIDTLLALSGTLSIVGGVVRYAIFSTGNTLFMLEPATSLLQSAGTTMVDNGSLLAMGLAGRSAPRPMGDVQYFLYVLIPLVLYVLLTGVLLRIAQSVLVRQGALRPARNFAAKAKKKRLNEAAG